MLKVLIGSLIGLAGHQAHGVIKRWEDEGTPAAWTLIARYIVGVFVALPVYILIRRGDERNSEADKDVQAFVLAFVSVGTGVALGHLIDELR